jgi:cardiolipin synthase
MNQKEKPGDVIIDRHYFVEDSLETIAQHLDGILTARHPEGTSFLVIAGDSTRYAQPVLLDRERGICVGLWLAKLYDSGQRGTGISTTADVFSAFVLESHGIALIKNPVTSAAKLVDQGVQLGIRVVRLPSLNFSKQFIPAGLGGGMDLDKWEEWLDRHSGTRLEQGSLEILIDGHQFYDRLTKAIRKATNYISAFVYLYDRDDTAIEIADLLKQRSRVVPVKISYDRMCSLIGAELPKDTPLPDDFTRPGSVARYLQKDSEVQVRCFLNPWMTMNHSKLFLVDGHRAWIGGMNVGRQYLHEWHDMMIQVEGPVVRSLEAQFERTWAHAGPWGDFAYAAVALAPTETSLSQVTPRPWAKVRRLPTSKGLRKPFMKAVLTALDQSRSYIYIENGYLFDHGVVNALARACKRGVDVRVILPRGNNYSMGQRSNMVTAEALRRHGVRVYLWPGMTHTKAVLVDGWACIGSANLNQWNFRLSQEENMATSDPDFGARLKKEVFEADFARCYELNQPISITPLDRAYDSIASY